MIGPPGTGGFGSSVFVTARSVAVTVTSALPELLPGVGSVAPVLPAVAMFVIVCPAPAEVARTVTVTVALPPEAMLPRSQVTIPATQVPCEGVALPTWTSPFGIGSSSPTEVAVDGPPLRTTIVKVVVSPTLIVAGEAVFVTERSALWLAAVVSEPLLLSKLMSPPPLTVAVLVTVPVRPGSVFAARWITG